MAGIKEMINHPKHYNIEGRKECIEEMIDKWGTGFVALWCEMTAYKYEYRAGWKDNSTMEEDNKKREWYLNKAKELNTISFEREWYLNKAKELNTTSFDNI